MRRGFLCNRRSDGIQEVDGSIPFGSTKQINNLDQSEASGNNFIVKFIVKVRTRNAERTPVAEDLGRGTSST